MRLIFIRHGEPDYEHDSLTEKGWREAKLLAARTKDWHVDDFYVSPLGRARDTASFTLKAHGKTAEIMDWLHEFLGKVSDGAGGTRLCWDLMPADWTAQPELLQPTGWEAAPLLQGTNVKAEYDRVTAGLDALLASYGYTRHGGYYTCRETCEKTIVCFCHFGHHGCSAVSPVERQPVCRAARGIPRPDVRNGSEHGGAPARHCILPLPDDGRYLAPSDRRRTSILLRILRRAVSGLNRLCRTKIPPAVRL